PRRVCGRRSSLMPGWRSGEVPDPLRGTGQAGGRSAHSGPVAPPRSGPPEWFDPEFQKCGRQGDRETKEKGRQGTDKEVRRNTWAGERGALAPWWGERESSVHEFSK